MPRAIPRLRQLAGTQIGRDKTVRASLPGTRRAGKFYRSCLHSQDKVHKILATKPTGEITPLPFTKRCQQRITTAGIARIREQWRD